MRKFYLRIILPTTLSILLFILTIFQIIIPRFQENIMNGKRDMIKELTNSAWSILAKYEADERDGLLSRELAQNTAKSRIQYLRYGEEGKDYFWITDMKPIMVMHPHRTDLNGKDLNNFKDPHGKRMFVEFVNTVKSNKHGYVDYMWQWKDDSLHIVPKLSYVKLFEPWGWIIGTGVYIEDVKKEISALTKRLITISIGISVIIAFLLLYIFKQSLNIERQRIGAETELHESREKYKTLVEAATEGLIMLIDGKISYSNSIISKISGYDPPELNNSPIGLILSKNNHPDIIETFSESTIKDGQYELNLQSKSGSLIEVIVTSSTAMFYGNTVNIIIVKDISIDRKRASSIIDYQRLINTQDFGFIKINIDRKVRFLYASERALRILGFSTVNELTEAHLPGWLSDTDERRQLIQILQTEGYLKNKIVKIQRRDKETLILTLSLVLLSNESSGGLVCDGIIEDITIRETEKAQSTDIIAQLKVSDVLTEHPVSDFVVSANTIDYDSEINEVVQRMSKRGVDCLLLTNVAKDVVGIITNSDLQKRVLSLNLNSDNPAYLIMSSPVVYIPANITVGEALKICHEKGISHPVIKDAYGKAEGIFNRGDINKRLLSSMSFYLEEIAAADNPDDLRLMHKSLRIMVRALVKSDLSVKYITNITSSFSDAATRRIVEWAIQELGPPPASFSFICLGSEGRREETLLTDQDNAIVYENVPKEIAELCERYFIKLGEKICYMLDHIGYSFCKGNVMAMNPQWCKPLREWENYFVSWIATPDAQNLLDASIFFDFRHVYGDDELAANLRKTVELNVQQSPLFLYHMAYNTYQLKAQQIPSGNIQTDKSMESFDLKAAVVPIIMFARTYALQHNVGFTNTIDRLVALKEKRYLNAGTADEIIFVYNFLMRLRIRNQVELFDEHGVVSNLLNVKKQLEIEVHLLRKALATLPDYQEKIKLDFKLLT